LTQTLYITIIIEGAVVIGYSLWRKRRVTPLLFTSICANLITQPLLCFTLNLFFRQYLIALLVGEMLIWLLESLLLYSVPANRLRLPDALLLSLMMNLVSFVPGWFLPV
jgi:hypothetical protein